MPAPGATPGGPPPWHMWGSSKVIDASSAGNQVRANSVQLARINYKRPETWSFFAAARLIGVTTTGLTNVTVSFDLIIGVGRTMFQTPKDPIAQVASGEVVPFVRFNWSSVDTTLVPQTRWTSVTQAPVFDNFATSPGDVRPLIEWFPAQDIQCSGNLIVGTAPGATATVSAELTCWFAPRSHMRPDWFMNAYRGDEVGGM